VRSASVSDEKFTEYWFMDVNVYLHLYIYIYIFFQLF